MDKQLIISVGREYGSGGHAIAEILAKHYDIPLYDYNLLNEVARERNLDVELLRQYDEKPKNYFFTRNVRGHHNSAEEHIANMQFDYLRSRAEEGKSFVVVGRCAESVLAEYSGLISIFVLGDMEKKVERIADRDHISLDEAEKLIYIRNRIRKSYHNYYCDGKWGDSRNYDISINSSCLGVQKTAELLISYIDQRRN